MKINKITLKELDIRILNNELPKENNHKYSKRVDVNIVLKDNINSPITIKIRAGWDNATINCDEVARIATKAGVDAIAIHGRTRAKMYQGESDNTYIKMVRDNTDKIVIPVE